MEPEHPKTCPNCLRFVKRTGWELVEVDLDRDGGTVWETRCKACGDIVRHIKHWN